MPPNSARRSVVPVQAHDRPPRTAQLDRRGQAFSKVPGKGSSAASRNRRERSYFSPTATNCRQPIAPELQPIRFGESVSTANRDGSSGMPAALEAQQPRRADVYDYGVTRTLFLPADGVLPVGSLRERLRIH